MAPSKNAAVWSEGGVGASEQGSGRKNLDGLFISNENYSQLIDYNQSMLHIEHTRQIMSILSILGGSLVLVMGSAWWVFRR